MGGMRTVAVDFDVWKLIQMERRSFDEPDHLALRRLLKLGPPPEEPLAPQPDAVPRDWSKGGVTLPHGTEIRMEYNGILHTGRIVDGAWEVEGHRAKSASGAAQAVARSKDGQPVNINGKAYWQVRRPGEADWTSYADLRRRK